MISHSTMHPPDIDIQAELWPYANVIRTPHILLGNETDRTHSIILFPSEYWTRLGSSKVMFSMGNTVTAII